VTSVPEHTGLDEAETDIPAGATGVTDIVTILDVAGLPVAQVRLDIRVHTITSLFNGVNV